MSRADRWFKRLLRLFPAEFRSDFGDDMRQTFKDQRDDTAARGEPMAYLRLWKDTIVGMLTTAPREHWDLLRQDIKYGLRNLRRNPGFAFVAVAALAVGIAANTSIFTIVNAILFQSRPYRDAPRLVTMFEKIPGVPVEKFGFSPPDFTIMREAMRSFDGFAAYRNVKFELSGVGRSERVMATRVSPDLFIVLGVMPAMGHAFTAEDDATNAKVAVLSDALWTRAFARDPNILGRTVALDRQPYTVVGVMPRRFVFPERGALMNGDPADLYIPISFTPGEKRAFGSNFNLSTIARLKAGVTIEQVRADIATAAAKVLAPQYPANLRGLGEQMLFPFGPFNEEVVGRSRRLLLVLMGAVGMVLLICCADIANLMLTRSGARRRELSIRSALGASQVRVMRQLLTESFVLALAGAALGLLLSFGLLKVFVAMAGETLPRLEEIQFSTRTVGFTVALALITPLIFGILPALRSALMSTSTAMKDGTRTTTPGRRRYRLLGGLVVAQCALALILSVGAGLLIRSFARLMQADLGFHAEQVVNTTMILPSGRYANGALVKDFYHQAVAAAAAIPGVAFAGAASDQPLNVRERRVFTADSSAPADYNRTVAATWTVGQYFETLGIPLKKGRLFTPADSQPGAEPVAIVSEMFAKKLWPNGDAVGHQFKWGIPSSPRPMMTIVGVVGDIKQGALDSEIVSQAYTPLESEVPDTMGGRVIGIYSEVNLIARSTRPPVAIVGEMQSVVRRLDPELAISKAEPVLDIVDNSVKTQRFSMTLLAVFAGVALALAALGIYGVLANVVVQQTQEIGVRLALGAATSSVIWIVLRRALIFTAIGIGIGLAGAYALTRAMSGLLYEVQPHDAIAFVAASVGLATLVIIASLVPAWRATRVDPIVALRVD